MLKKEQAQPEKKYLSISLNRIFWSMKIRFSARRVLSRISFDMNWRKISRCKSKASMRAFISSILCRTAKNTVFVRTVCGLLVKSVEPEDTSLTHTNAVELCEFVALGQPPKEIGGVPVERFTFHTVSLILRTLSPGHRARPKLARCP